MKRKLGAITAFLCLCGAGAAAAAGPVTGGPNTYSGSFAVSGPPGSAAKPTAIALTESLQMGSATAGDVGAPLTNIRTTTYGVRAPNGAMFPKCTANTINANGNSGKWNSVCPKNSLVATGPVDAVLVPNSLQGPGATCDLELSVYNGGPGKLTFFFTIPTTGPGCDGLATGAAAAWTGTVSQAGKYLITNVPEPADVSYNAGGTGLFGSLQTEVLHFKRITVKKGKKTYPFVESFGCTKHARPYTITYTATESNSGSPTVGSGTVKGSAACG
jgi:hypothetical protein